MFQLPFWDVTLGLFDLLELRAQGAEPLIPERKVGSGDVEHPHLDRPSPHAHLGPLADAVQRSGSAAAPSAVRCNRLLAGLQVDRTTG